MAVPYRFLLFSLLAAGAGVFSLQAHDDLLFPSSGKNPGFTPIAFGLPGSKVSMVEKNGKLVIDSNDIPNHETGQFPGPGNPSSIRAQDLHFEITLQPKVAPRIRQVRPSFFGIALNGVKFDPGTGEFWHQDPRWNEEAIVNGQKRLGLDENNAHVQPDGSYHYHGLPDGLVRQLNGQGRMVLLGWAADGFPVYGSWAYRDSADARSAIVEMKSSYRLKSGLRPGGEEGPGGVYDGMYTDDFEFVKGAGDLDECNGRTGVTPEFPAGIYYYVITQEFPQISRFFKGTPDPSFMRGPMRRPPGGAGPMGPGGPGPGPGNGARPGPGTGPGFGPPI